MSAPFTQIVVPLDGSPAAERALAPALTLASRTGAPLTVLSRVSAGDEEELATYLAGIADRHADVTDVETMIVDQESAVLAITGAVGPGTLVCMASHGRGRSEGVLGSVAESVLRDLGEPVLVVGPAVPADMPPLSGRVVACLDGSETAEAALDPAEAWAAALGLPLWLIEVVPVAATPTSPEAPDVLDSATVALAAQHRPGVEAWEVLHGDDPARAIADHVASAPVGLLVMTTHGRTGWRRLVLGSVVASTIRSAAAPVLVVPAPRD